MRLVTLSTVVAFAFQSTPVSADVYSDATDIIRALIERNIAKEAIPELASRVPLLCDYFPASMAALQALRFNGLPAVIHKEIADVIGLKVLLVMRPPANSPNVSTGAVSHLDAINRLRAPEKQVLVSRCAQLPEPNAEHPDAPSFEGIESRATEALAQCVAPQSDLKDEVACALALLTRDAALIDDTGVLRNLQRASIALILSALGTAVKADDAARLTSLLGQALRAGKLDAALVTQFVTDQLISGAPVATWKIVAPLLDAQLDKVSVEAAFAIASALATRCNTHDECKLVAEIAKNDQVWRMVKLLQSRDYGGAAQAAVKILVNVACPPCTDKDQAVLTFVEKLTVYTVDSIRANAASSSVSADFRSAATDLIEMYSGPGIHGYAYGLRGIFFPRFALRRASRSGRGSLDSVDYPSIDTLTLRVVPYFTDWVYVSPSITVVDLLGPFTELAVGADAIHRRGTWKAFLWGFVTPRFDLELGVPALSDNLVIGAGLAVRLYRAVPNGDSPTYCVPWGCPNPSSLTNS